MQKEEQEAFANYANNQLHLLIEMGNHILRLTTLNGLEMEGVILLIM